MTIVEEEMPGGITKVVLDGRLDAEAAASVDFKMSLIANTRNAVLLDLRLVTFLASSGLRSLVIPAQTIKSRGGRIALFGPNEMVEKVLRTSGIDSVIPVHRELSAALAAMQH